MITTLAIKNYALIEDIRVDLQEGLTIITGETGAGKSILLGALALILGKRADLSSVKVASQKCIIEGEFSIKNYGLQALFHNIDLDYDDQTIIRREILPSGKSRAFVNDTPVSLVQLQKLGTHLVDVHSQHETLSLSSENFQIEIIDVLAGNEPLLEAYSGKLEEFRNISETINTLKNDKDRVAKELDYNTFLCSELVEADLKGLIQKELEDTFETLNNSEIIQESFSQIVQVLSDERIGTLETAKEARIVLGKIRGFSSQFEQYWDRLNSTIIELEDVFDGIEDLATSVEANPSKLLEINEKLQVLYKLQQKHGVATVAELIEIQDDLESKIDSVVNMDERLERLEKERSKFSDGVLKTGRLLHKQRQKAIPLLKNQLEAYLAELGLPNARFKFELIASENFRMNGTDSLELLFTANKGLSFGSLKKIASGGEMSRIMLSVKAILARYKKLPTIIFDEIDTGVSGEIANKMARIMGEMSNSTQLLSITHLPQIAAKGEYHIKVYKEDVNDVTRTRLRVLNEDERIVEIAQMIGGNSVTDAAIANAKELLN
ncbi:MAG: DNA repair protein RecN (Recombination protein N) [Flavobacteriaceae bacterium]